MITSTYSKLAARLKTMKGFPAWSDEVSDNYWLDLNDLTDAVGLRMAKDVGRKFGDRPSAKDLREWAAVLAPAPAFTIGQIAGPRPGSHLRLVGPGMDRLGHVAKAVGPAPPELKEALAPLRNNPVSAEGRREYGLQYRNRKTNHTDRTQPSHSEGRASALAEERNRRWPHIETTVFRRGDPWPAGAVRTMPDLAMDEEEKSLAQQQVAT